MISFYNIGTMGRLGNQLFQYAAGRGVSLRLGVELQLPKNIDERQWHGQTCLINNFNLNAQFSDKWGYKKQYSEVYLTKNHLLHKANDISPCFKEIKNHTDLVGHFDNHLYFHEFRNEIASELQIKSGEEEVAKTFLRSLKEKYGVDKEIVSIHFRRGDVSGQQPNLYHTGASKGIFNWNSEFGHYLDEALKYFQENKYIFLLFTGGVRNEGTDRQDMHWVKTAFPTEKNEELLFEDQKFMRDEMGKRGLTPDNIVYAENNTTLMDFALMKNCEHNIMGLHSTYSWWTCYLNSNPNRKIISPRIFKDPKKGHYPEDFILTRWSYEEMLDLEYEELIHRNETGPVNYNGFPDNNPIHLTSLTPLSPQGYQGSRAN